RLYRKYEKESWQLFDLKSDPREEKNVAAENAGLVKELASRHADWASTLVPLIEVPKIDGEEAASLIGHGWARAN
ncbi:MAG: hypothetical protein AAF394_05675, partial [Planctomycetota bacterium]